MAIPRELLKKIRKIEIYTSRLVNNQLAGQYHSVFKGRGMAFSEVRQYVPGDDIRAIDWNVSARMNEPHVKLFTEERDRTVNLMIDMSASGLFGSSVQAKREVAAEIAALVAFSAIKNDDRVGLFIFTDRVELYVPPKKGKKHVLRVVREILTFQPTSPRTNIAVGLEYLGKVSRRKSVTFLVSDFLAHGWERQLQMANRRHDVVPVVITDPMEESLPKVGLVTFEDVETGEVTEFDTSGPEADLFRESVTRQRQLREQALRRLKMDFVNVVTNKPYVDALVAFFRTRARRQQVV
ncbi:MAG TPA: DUF58 domain-containing protein [Kofleriaceae bacterium]|nr:DUF58 domain-containing protein [Kofleriaceae bacterium]